jgi:hypothetical protein
VKNVTKPSVLSAISVHTDHLTVRRQESGMNFRAVQTKMMCGRELIQNPVQNVVNLLRKIRAAFK